MKLFSGSNDTKGNEPPNANEHKLPEVEKESLLLPDVGREEALPIVQFDYLDALEKLHPGFLDWYGKESILKHGSGHDIEKMLLTGGLFYKLLGHTNVLRLLFYAGYLQGQKDERKRMDDLFDEVKLRDNMVM